MFQTDAETLKMQEHDIRNKKKLAVELVCKVSRRVTWLSPPDPLLQLLTYTAIGFNCCFLAPGVFRALGCERPAFYTGLLVLVT